MNRAEPRPSAAAMIAAVSGALAIGSAIWLLPASITIVQWPASGPTRLALLRPAWQLGAILLVALAAGVGMAVLKRGTRLLAASSWLWLWTLPFLPWLPDRLPLMLVLAGPIRWVIPAALVAWAVSRFSAWSAFSATLLNAGRRTVFVASLAIYATCGLWAASTQGVIGDEPHYLIISDSLLRDGDIQIENNHRRGDYREYFGGDLRPDYMARGKNGEIYSIHAPGLPVLQLPAYAAGGRRGAVLFIALLAAFAALAVFDLARLISGQSAAVLTWLAVCLSVPFVPYSWAIFPEMPGTLLVAWAALWLWQPADRSTTTWLLRGLALAVFPWLHTKFAVFLGAFGAAHAVRLLRNPRALIAFLTPMGVSGLLWLYSFYAIYGVVNPEAPYGLYAHHYILTRNIPHGLIGMFFDQKFGLLFYSPIYLVSVVGAWLLWKRPDSRFQVAVVVGVVLAFVSSTARLYMFWGGSSAPARFLVPIAACLAPLVAAVFPAARTAVARAVLGVWLAVGLSIAVIAMLRPERLILFSDPHGRARILEVIQGSAPLALIVPTFTDPDWVAHVAPLAAWLAGSLAALGCAWLIGRSGRLSAWSVGAAATLVFFVGGAVATSRPSAEARDDAARRGAVDAITRFDGNRYRTLDYRELSRVTPERFRDLTTIALALPPPPRPGEDYLTLPVTLPAGAYDARVWFDNAAARTGRIRVDALRQATFASYEGTLGNVATVPFELPVDVRRIAVGVEGEGVAAAIARIEIVPRSVVPPEQRTTLPIRVVESVRERPHAFLAYTDEHAYPENGIFWTRGTAATTILIAPADARRLTLRLSTGPMSGTVTVSANGESRSVAMAGGSENTVSFDLAPDARLVPVTIQSSVMFRPGEVDRTVRDMRGLGCQVYVILE